MTNKNNILKANEIGLNNKDSYIGFECAVFDKACELGQKGVDLSSCDIVTGWRYGKNNTGISYNFRDQRKENGLSLMAVNGEEANPASIFINPVNKCEYTGILLPMTGSDDESLILPFEIEEYDF